MRLCKGIRYLKRLISLLFLSMKNRRKKSASQTIKFILFCKTLILRFVDFLFSLLDKEKADKKNGGKNAVKIKADEIAFSISCLYSSVIHLKREIEKNEWQFIRLEVFFTVENHRTKKNLHEKYFCFFFLFSKLIFRRFIFAKFMA